MSQQDTFDLASIREDGWFQRTLGANPALVQLCSAAGEPLVAFALAAGLRMTSMRVDQAGRLSHVSWVYGGAGSDEDDTTEERGGDLVALRTDVLSILLRDREADGDTVPDTNSMLRQTLGEPFILLAPLFGLELRSLFVGGPEPRVTVAHDGTEETVPVRLLRRFLRAQVVESLQAEGGRQVAIDLRQAELARAALHAGRFTEVVAILGGWVGPLMAYIRTPEGASLESGARADLARSLSTLAEALGQLGRGDEAGEAVRLGIQYAYDSPAMAELYHAHARMLITQDRHDEAIGPLRRAMSLRGESPDSLLLLARCYLAAKRAVAALGCVRRAKQLGADLDAVVLFEQKLRVQFGAQLDLYDGFMRDERPTQRPAPPGDDAGVE